MKKIFIYLSIILHIIIIVISLFQFSDIFKKTIKDNGYAMFDFVNIGDKSTAPVLSKESGKTSKIKSYDDNKNKEENIINKKNDNAKQSLENKNDSKNNEIKKDNIKDKKKDIDDKKQKVTKIKENKTSLKPFKKDSKDIKNKKIEKTNKTSNKSSSKSNGKALVNLKQNKKSFVKPSNNTNKKSFNSFLDNVLADGDNENTGANAESLGETLTATQVDQIRNTIRKCWHFPAGLKDAETLVVDIKMELDRSGYVKRAEVVDKTRMRRDSGFKIAAENAQRAVLDPRCNPLPLPKEKYEEWKDLELSFNPKDMLG